MLSYRFLCLYRIGNEIIGSEWSCKELNILDNTRNHDSSRRQRDRQPKFALATWLQTGPETGSKRGILVSEIPNSRHRTRRRDVSHAAY